MNQEYLQQLLQMLKEYIPIFNNWESTKEEEKDKYNYIYLSRIYINLIDILINNNIIERYGIKKYKIIETGEII